MYAQVGGWGVMEVSHDAPNGKSPTWISHTGEANFCSTFFNLLYLTVIILSQEH